MGNLEARLQEMRPVLVVNPGGPGLAAMDATVRAGAEAVFIDCEGTPTGIQDAAQMARLGRAAGLSVLLRSDRRDAAGILRYLDCGIDGLVMPQMEDPAEVARVALLVASHGAARPATALVVQIETPAGRDRLEAIATTPGVAAILIGPNDLAAAMGHAGRPDAAPVAAAVTDIADRLAALGVPFGLPVAPGSVAHWTGRGARILYLTLGQLAALGLAEIRRAAA